jgi:hypothetical protein
MSKTKKFRDLVARMPSESRERREKKQNSVMCMYCGLTMGYDSADPEGIAAVYEALLAHDAECSKNPILAGLRAAEARIAELEEAMAQLENVQQVCSAATADAQASRARADAARAEAAREGTNHG